MTLIFALVKKVFLTTILIKYNFNYRNNNIVMLWKILLTSFSCKCKRLVGLYIGTEDSELKSKRDNI
jgi:hypothetical protein